MCGNMKRAILVTVCAGLLGLVSGQTWASDALLEAALGGDRAAVQRELQAGVDVNYQNDHYNWTALMFAAFGGHTAIVQLLLEAGAHVDLQDKHSSARGETALMKAEKKGHTDIAQLLRSAWRNAMTQQLGGKY